MQTRLENVQESTEIDKEKQSVVWVMTVYGVFYYPIDILIPEQNKTVFIGKHVAKEIILCIVMISTTTVCVYIYVCVGGWVEIDEIGKGIAQQSIVASLRLHSRSTPKRQRLNKH